MSDIRDGSNIFSSNLYDDMLNYLIDSWINFHHPISRYFGGLKRIYQSWKGQFVENGWIVCQLGKSFQKEFEKRYRI